MTHTKHFRAAKVGALKSVRLDTTSLARLALCKRIANEFIGTKATSATIVRRALSLLEHHYGSLLEKTAADPRLGYTIKRLESVHLGIANAAKDIYGIRVDDVTGAPVLKSIADLAKDKAADKPRLIDEVTRDIERWRKDLD